jgi:hypothetical protein
MKYLTLFFFSLLICFNLSYSQTVQTHYETPVVITGDSWDNDVLVSNSEPFGNLSGVEKSNGTIYLAVPDTNITADRCIVVFRSTNLGNNWTNFASISPASVVPRIKMVRSGLDSVYLFFLFNSSVYCWNVENNNLNQFTTYTNLRDFDAEASSTGSLYLAIDIATNRDIRFYGSVNGGVSWPSTIYLSSTGARCRWYMSPGDTLSINYMSPVLADTLTSTIRNVKYRESTPGTLSIVGTFGNVEPSTAPKSEYQSVYFRGNIWLFYTSGSTGAIDIYCRLSTNAGTSYSSPFLVAGNPNTDEYWFDVKHYTSGTGGIDFAYYSDSLQAGSPNNNTDKMLYVFANLSTPSTFSTPAQFSGHAPGWSARGYIPAMVELYNTSDVGVAWVGLDGSNMRVYWDRYLAVVGVPKNQNEVASSFVLGQNYPNPFNPSTKIEFTLPKDEFVSIKVYDLLGREVAVLVSKNLKQGTYEVQFDASRLSSGVYFYRMDAGNFTGTKKMLLIK